jgi:hypothetical protein
MAKKLNLDTEKIKLFFIQKGERFGLGVAGGITFLVLLFGVILGGGGTAPSSGDTWSGAITKAVQNLDNKKKTTEPDPVQDPDVPIEAMPASQLVALLATPDDLAPVVAASVMPAGFRNPAAYPINKNPLFALLPEWFNPRMKVDHRRRNPEILPLGDAQQVARQELTPQEAQIDYVPASCLAYDVSLTSQTYSHRANDSTKTPLMVLEPKTMVIVSGLFQYKEQLERYAQALRLDTPPASNSPDRPQMVGLNVWRVETGPDGKEGKSVPIYQFDEKKGTITPNAGLYEFLRKVVINTQNPAALEGYLAPNMVTPLPQLAGQKYPRLGLPGVEMTAEAEPESKTGATTGAASGGFFPGVGGGGAGGDRSSQGANFKALPQDLKERIAQGLFNPFDPLGKPPVSAKDQANQPAMAMVKDKDGSEKEAENLLARFIDIDVEAGKTYRYWIQVVARNPNFKSKDVSYEELARKEFLLSPWKKTPPITIPPAFSYYAFEILNKKDFQSHVTGLKGNDIGNTTDQKMAFQIHRWITQSEDRFIGGWVIAEKLLIERGDMIGRPKVQVEVPEWNKLSGQFELMAPKKGRGTKGIPIDFFMEGSAPPLLVDFTGGKHSQYRAGRTGNVQDEAALRALVVDSDGRIVVLDSRVDADPQTDRGKLRKDHYDSWASRLIEARNAGKSNTPGAGSFPKTK